MLLDDNWIITKKTLDVIVWGCFDLFEPKSQSSMLLAFTQHGHKWTKQSKPLRTDLEITTITLKFRGFGGIKCYITITFINVGMNI